MRPKEYFLTRGIGQGKNEIEAFEMALRCAGIEKLNLVQVSSIIPGEAKEIELEEGIKKLRPGDITFCVMARKIFKQGTGSAAIGVARGDADFGYFVEIVRNDLKAREEAIETAARLFRSRFGKEPLEVKAVSAEAEADTLTCILACAVLL